MFLYGLPVQLPFACIEFMRKEQFDINQYYTPCELI